MAFRITTKCLPTAAKEKSPEKSEAKHQVSLNPEEHTILPLVCRGCRERHLKCDGNHPCGRCQAGATDCRYVISMRGYKGTGKAHSKPTTSHEPSSFELSSSSFLPASYLTADMSARSENTALPVPVVPESISLAAGVSTQVSGTQLSRVRVDKTLSTTDTYSPTSLYRKRCLEAFFHFFYNSHPFLPPRIHTLGNLKRMPTRGLETAIYYIGSQYVSKSTTSNFRVELEALLADSHTPNDASLVQTLILYSMGLDGSNEQLKSLEVLTRAQNLALQIGMHQQDFAVVNGSGCPILEESMRRTWWELYVLDGMMAGLHRISRFNLYEVMGTVDLPCEEDDFQSGHIPTPHTILEYDQSSFTFSQVDWSSYTYRIAAVRILGRILSLKDVVYLDNSLSDKLEISLSSWRLHLPCSKKSYFNKSGQIDELMFQAHMITDVSSILLHRHYSELSTFSSHTITSCAPYPQTNLALQQSRVNNVRAIQAADNIIKFIGLPTSLAKHSHFFIYAIALASIVHLSSWSTSLPTDENDEVLKGQIRMSMGGLKELAGIWPSARWVLGQVTKVAQEIFKMHDSNMNAAFWTSSSDEDIFGALVGVNSLDNEFQLMQQY